jgi:hypothetical protein
MGKTETVDAIQIDCGTTWSFSRRRVGRQANHSFAIDATTVRPSDEPTTRKSPEVGWLWLSLLAFSCGQWAQGRASGDERRRPASAFRFAISPLARCLRAPPKRWNHYKTSQIEQASPSPCSIRCQARPPRQIPRTLPARCGARPECSLHRRSLVRVILGGNASGAGPDDCVVHPNGAIVRLSIRGPLCCARVSKGRVAAVIPVATSITSPAGWEGGEHIIRHGQADDDSMDERRKQNGALDSGNLPGWICGGGGPELWDS